MILQETENGYRKNGKRRAEKSAFFFGKFTAFMRKKLPKKINLYENPAIRRKFSEIGNNQKFCYVYIQ
jgi:hypothetical protein